VPEHGLLRDHAAGVPDGRHQTEDRAQRVVETVARGRHPDHKDAGKRDKAAREQPGWEALPKDHTGEDRYQDRPTAPITSTR